MRRGLQRDIVKALQASDRRGNSHHFFLCNNKENWRCGESWSMIIFSFISDFIQALARWITGSRQRSVLGLDGSFMRKGLCFAPLLNASL